MAAEIATDLGQEPQLIKGSGGIFVVTADGKVVFDKKQAGRFPNEREVVDLITRAFPSA